MSDEIEDALRRELTGRLVPFDEGRAEDMIRAAAEAGLANTPRAWVAPLAAAAAVVVVGGGVALATAGGGGSSASGPEQPGGPGISASNGAGANAVPCAPLGSDDTDVGVVVEASGEAVGPGLSSAPPPVYTAVNEASSATVYPPYPPTVSPTSEPTATATDLPLGTASDVPIGSATEVPAGTLTAVPAGGASSGPVDLTPSGRTVICLVGPATPVELGSASCTKGHHSVTCVSVGYCTAPEDNPPTPPASSDGPDNSNGPDNSVLCVDEGSGSVAPPPLPTVSGSEEMQPGTVGTNCECNASVALSSGAGAFSINTTVAPGESRTFDGPAFSAGQAFVATAFVLQNPAADEGTLTIEGDRANRLSEALSDFRNVDFHFDHEAITYDADHPLRVTVDCANSSTACTPAVLVSGHWTHN